MSPARDKLLYETLFTSLAQARAVIPPTSLVL
jgi:hypothetical protein